MAATMGVEHRFAPRMQAPRYPAGMPVGMRQPFQPQGMSGAPRGFRAPMGNMNISYDGKRIRNKTVLRKTVDFNAACITHVKNRLWQQDFHDQRAVQPDELYVHDLLPPPALINTPMNCVTSRFVRNSMNKIRCPIFCVCWTPEGRRLITGASSGEFTLWNGLTFNFETILQAHDTSVRCMTWSHNDQWMLTADHGGFVKYWQINMNNVKMYQAHKEPIRGVRWALSTATREVVEPLAFVVGIRTCIVASMQCVVVGISVSINVSTDFNLDKLCVICTAVFVSDVFRYLL